MIKDNLIITGSLQSRYHYHQRLHHHHPFAYKELRVTEGVAGRGRMWVPMQVCLILMIGALFSLTRHTQTLSASESQGSGAW